MVFRRRFHSHRIRRVVCTRALGRLEMPSKDMSYKEVRDDMVEFIERRSGSTVSGPTLIDVRNQQEHMSTFYAPEF